MTTFEKIIFLADKIGRKNIPEDIANVAKEYMSSDRDKLNGLSITLEVNKATNKVEYKTIRLGIEFDSDLTEYEVADIELDDEIVELLLSKVE